MLTLIRGIPVLTLLSRLFICMYKVRYCRYKQIYPYKNCSWQNLVINVRSYRDDHVNLTHISCMSTLFWCICWHNSLHAHVRVWYILEKLWTISMFAEVENFLSLLTCRLNIRPVDLEGKKSFSNLINRSVYFRYQNRHKISSTGGVVAHWIPVTKGCIYFVSCLAENCPVVLAKKLYWRTNGRTTVIVWWKQRLPGP